MHGKTMWQQVFFFGEFSQPGDKKKGGGRGAGESNKGIFEIFLTNSPYLDQKNLEVARFRQCVPAGRQSGQDLKKDLLAHQDSRHLLLINAEDPSQCTYLRNLKKKKHRWQLLGPMIMVHNSFKFYPIHNPIGFAFHPHASSLAYYPLKFASNFVSNFEEKQTNTLIVVKGIYILHPFGTLYKQTCGTLCKK